MLGKTAVGFAGTVPEQWPWGWLQSPDLVQGFLGLKRFQIRSPALLHLLAKEKPLQLWSDMVGAIWSGGCQAAAEASPALCKVCPAGSRHWHVCQVFPESAELEQ